MICGENWSAEEDQLLKAAYALSADKSDLHLQRIACVLNKTVRQCRTRWNTLNGKKLWVQEEDDKILYLINIHGMNWSLVSTMFSRRTESEIQNRYIYLKKKRNAAKARLNFDSVPLDTQDTSSDFDAYQRYITTFDMPNYVFSKRIFREPFDRTEFTFS